MPINFRCRKSLPPLRNYAPRPTPTRCVAELTDAPFAISNLGMLGVDQFDAFVFHGQTAVLSVGRSVTEGGKTLAWFGLAVDHRVVDGAEAARFLETLQSEIAA